MRRDSRFTPHGNATDNEGSWNILNTIYSIKSSLKEQGHVKHEPG